MPNLYSQDDDRLIHEAEMEERLAERRLHRERRARPTLVGCVAFTIGMADLAYGGPEEGGWYFDTFEPVRVFIVGAHRAEALERRLNAWIAANNEGRPSISSVNSAGQYRVRRGIRGHEPSVRPHYE